MIELRADRGVSAYLQGQLTPPPPTLVPGWPAASSSTAGQSPFGPVMAPKAKMSELILQFGSVGT